MKMGETIEIIERFQKWKWSEGFSIVPDDYRLPRNA